MTPQQLIAIIQGGETSTVQFKANVHNELSIAQEMIAFANTKGGKIIIGIDDKTWDLIGLTDDDLRRLSNLLANAASVHIKESMFIETATVMIDDKKVLVVTVPEGIAKPYKDNDGTIFMKNGANKRKVTSNDEIFRLLSKGKYVLVDEFPVPAATIDDLDEKAFAAYFVKEFKQTYEELGLSYAQALRAKRVIKDDEITLAGMLFFGKNPQFFRPAFCLKAVAFYGNSLGGCDYRDSRDYTGTLSELYTEGLAFFKRNLLHTQQGQNFNSPGILEISEIALLELLQNALLHRDYTRNSPIRLLVFDNRLEIISPGSLPNSLTIEELKYGNPIVRNNLLVSYAQHLLPYKGLGSGIKRALQEQPNIQFENQAAGEQFIVTIPRPEK